MYWLPRFFTPSLPSLRQPLYLFFGKPQENAHARPAETPVKRIQGECPRMTAKVTVADVERVAELAHLELTPEETEPMLRDLNAILDYVAELNQLDTSGIEPLAQVGELENAAVPQPRPDVVAPSLDRAAVMAQAPETDGAFFKVPKVIER
jgi:aspartyl-tRNA(Asn)/glutamyl-tRNA(Gln) amidotransferase subunit C